MRDRLILAANIAIFAVLVFIALEMTLRIYLFGITGLNPVKVNSFVNIFASGLVQPADNLEVWYELKPNQDTLFRGAPFRTNTQGLADDDYSYEKPPNTYRVAVIGSSWTMGAAVALEDTFHSVLEREFNRESDSTRYEFINFGVENYGLGEMMATVNHKALRYDPDMILFVVTGFTPSIRWVPHDAQFEPLPRRNPFGTSYVVLRLAGMLGIQIGESGSVGALRDRISDREYGLYFRQLRRAFDQLSAINTARQIPVAAVWLLFNEPGAAKNRLPEMFLRKADDAGFTGAVVDLENYLEPGQPMRKLLVNRSEKHPNEYGHKMIAAELREKLFPDGPPTVQNP